MKPDQSSLRLLVVGDVRHWLDDGRHLPRRSSVCFLDVADLTAERLGALLPDIVLTPLLSADFDVVDVAQRLCALGFNGRLRAIAPLLPNPGVVTRELRQICPSLDFDILEIDPASVRPPARRPAALHA